MSSKLEEIEDRLQQEAAALDAEMKPAEDQVKAELAHLKGKTDTKVQALQDQMDEDGARMDAALAQYEAMSQAVYEEEQAEIESRMAEAKTYYETQQAKLAEASKHIKDALQS